jgi:hypothetical protein
MVPLGENHEVNRGSSFDERFQRIVHGVSDSRGSVVLSEYFDQRRIDASRTEEKPAK